MEIGDNGWPFIQAVHWTIANRKKIRLVVIHTMEAPEKPTTAEGVARWFAGQLGPAPRASAHACVDNDSLVRCVKPEHIACAAPGANRDGYHVEHAGYARQSPQEWQDAYSQGMLRISATHVAGIARDWSVPIVKLTPEDLLAGKSGFCGHVDVNKAYHRSTHTDPGPCFPWEQYLNMVSEALLSSLTGEELDALDSRPK